LTASANPHSPEGQACAALKMALNVALGRMTASIFFGSAM
jgi:hypothetical protein